MFAALLLTGPMLLNCFVVADLEAHHYEQPAIWCSTYDREECVTCAAERSPTCCMKLGAVIFSCLAFDAVNHSCSQFSIVQVLAALVWELALAPLSHKLQTASKRPQKAATKVQQGACAALISAFFGRCIACRRNIGRYFN
eukprot:365193-Chlamydomonas_euryale.AAC.3